MHHLMSTMDRNQFLQMYGDLPGPNPKLFQNDNARNPNNEGNDTMIQRLLMIVTPMTPVKRRISGGAWTSELPLLVFSENHARNSKIHFQNNVIRCNEKGGCGECRLAGSFVWVNLASADNAVHAGIRQARRMPMHSGSHIFSELPPP